MALTKSQDVENNFYYPVPSTKPMSTKTSFQGAKNPFMSIMTDSCEDLSVNSRNDDD